jgi:hypothetical protein
MLINKMDSGEIDYVPSDVKVWPQAHSAIAMNGFPCYFDQDQVYNLKDDPYDLTQIPFMETAEYRKPTEKNLAFDLLSIRWSSRDHGFILWPPEED